MEADAYNSVRDEIPCTANNFRLHLEGTPAHPWNKSATGVFVASFCEKYPQYSIDETEDHFKVHLDTLIRKYRNQQRSKDDPIAAKETKKQNRKNSRKASVSPFLLRSHPRY